MPKYQDPNFDKETYRKNRQEGRRGTMPGLGSKSFGNELRRRYREAQAKNIAKLKGGRRERKKLKSLKKSV